MSSAFHCRPSNFFGLTSADDTWLAYQIDRSVFTFGSFIQARIEETKKIPAKKDRKETPMETVPAYTQEQIEKMIYGPLPEPGENVKRGEPTKWGNIDPFAVEAEDSRPVPARYRNGPTILPHEMTN